MKKQQVAELTRLLRFQQSLLNLSAKCSHPDALRKRPVTVTSRMLAQLARKVESQAG
ncbi:MAG: hypothetical protein ACOYX1_09360 [Acidobacteriota bacterium]